MSPLLPVVSLGFMLLIAPVGLLADEVNASAGLIDSAGANDSAGMWELRLRHQLERTRGEGRYHQHVRARPTVRASSHGVCGGF